MNIKDRLIQIVGAERFSDDKTALYCYSRDVSLAKGVPEAGRLKNIGPSSLRRKRGL